MAKSRVQQGILARIARRIWGLETSLLRVATDAVVTKLLRYGMAISGPRVPEDLICKLDVQVIN